MLVLLPRLAVLIILAAAWNAGRTDSTPRAVRARLLAVFVLAGLLRVALAWLGHSSAGAAQTAAAFTAEVVALLLLWPLAHLALAAPFKRGGRVTRTVFLSLGVITLSQGAYEAALFFLFVGLLRHPWLSVLGTGERFRASIASLAVALALLLGVNRLEALPGAVAAAHDLAWMVRGIIIGYAGFGALRAFKAFTTDSTLGIRRVSRRLALSHILVVTVPLLIVVALWISSTYLGVNADRALVTARAVDREAANLQQALRVALATSGEAAAAAAGVRNSYAVRWPGTRVFALKADRVVTAVGPHTAGADELGGWVAGLDTLADHGVVQLASERWLGAAARRGDEALVLLAPIGEVLDSTLSPLMGAEVTMSRARQRDAAMDSLSEQVADARAALREQERRSAADDSTALVKMRAVARALGIPDSVVKAGRRGGPVVVSAGNDTLSSASGDIGLTGQVAVRGVRRARAGWEADSFTLTARASFRSTLIGLFAKLRENPLQAIPVLALAGLGLLLFPLAMTNLSMVRGMGGSITTGISALREGAMAFGAGRLAHRIPIAGDDDLWDTARQFNDMAHGLERARELEKERDRFENELEVARRIQARLLPAGSPHIGGLDVAGLSESAREVGGDYYDHLDLGGGRVLLVIADVSGKGVPAALLMSGFRASLMSQDTSAGAPEVVAARVNEFLHKSVEPGRFVTAFFGFLDATTGRFVYVSAGHNPPVLLRADGSVELLSEGGLILGIMPGSLFTSGVTTLGVGDLVALYTDGVTEGADAANEQWGEERLVATLRAAGGASAHDIAHRIVREVRAFEGESGPADDITVLIARRVPRDEFS
jgi:HAMP domain-containing protein